MHKCDSHPFLPNLHAVIKCNGEYLFLCFVNVYTQDGGGVAEHLAHRLAAVGGVDETTHLAPPPPTTPLPARGLVTHTYFRLITANRFLFALQFSAYIQCTYVCTTQTHTHAHRYHMYASMCVRTHSHMHTWSSKGSTLVPPGPVRLSPPHCTSLSSQMNALPWES